MASKARAVLIEAGPTVEDLERSFLRYLKASNKAKSTLEIYGFAVKAFRQFLARAGMPQHVGGITREHVESYIADVLTTRKPATASAYYRALQAFFKWAAEEGR